MALPAPCRGERVPRAALETDLEEEALLLCNLLLCNISNRHELSDVFLPLWFPLKDFSRRGLVLIRSWGGLTIRFHLG
jgi:hypothetical protein